MRQDAPHLGCIFYSLLELLELLSVLAYNIFTNYFNRRDKMAKKKNAVTAKDVARAAGVSQSTVGMIRDN